MQKRNVLVILCDQLRRDFIGPYGSEAVTTPHLDRLAHEGVVFDNALAASPVCAPCRASMMTGRFPADHGVWMNDLPFREGLDYLPQKMNNLGYSTACFGKLHHYPADDVKGFQYARQMEEGRLREQEPYLKWLKSRLSDKDIDAAQKNDIFHCDRKKWQFKLPQELHYEYWIASEAINYFETNRKDGKVPFFAWISFQGPHSPYNPPREASGLCDAAKLKPPLERREERICPIHFYRSFIDVVPENSGPLERIREAYGEHVAFIDRQIGRIITCLESLGVWENTTVLFSSDHGDLLGDYDLMGKGASGYASNVNVPMILAHDPHIEAQSRSTALVNTVDIPATVLEAAGSNDGLGLSRSLIDAASKNPQFIRRLNFSEYGDAAKILEDERYRYVYYPVLGYRELFDRAEDPDLSHNLAGQQRYADIEIKFLMAVTDFATGNTGPKTCGFDFVPDTQEALRNIHPWFDRPGEFPAAFPLVRLFKDRLKRAGLDPNYTNFYKNQRVLASYGLDFEEL